jgi:hypothetical protein
MYLSYMEESVLRFSHWKRTNSLNTAESQYGTYCMGRSWVAQFPRQAWFLLNLEFRIH